MNINKVVLGTVQFGLNYGINNNFGKPSQETVNDILKCAYSSGIRRLDTAAVYGDAHNVIGEFHKTFKGKKFDVTTKLPNVLNNELSETLDEYLKLLHLESLNGVLFHSFESYSKNSDCLNELIEFKKQGKIKRIGVSVYTNSEMQKVIDDDAIDVIQLPFNLLDNWSLRGELILKAKERGKSIQSRSVYLQGLFFLPDSSENNVAMQLGKHLNALKTISNDQGISVQKLALAYCLQQKHIDDVLIGVDSLQQLNQNIADSAFELPKNVFEEVNRIIVDDVNLLNPSLWK